MRKFLFLMFLGIFMRGLFAASAAAFHYENCRFGYSVNVPESFVPQLEAENGDGRTFISSSSHGEIAVWGVYNVFEQSLAKAAEFASREHKIAYRRLNKKQNWFVLSWFDDEGQIVYLRQWLSGGTIYALQFTYPPSEQKTFDIIIKDMTVSFKILSQPHSSHQSSIFSTCGRENYK